MSTMLRKLTILVLKLGLPITLMISPPAHSAITTPDCETMEPWVLSIDAKKRWYPDPGNKRFWLPSAFEAPAFDAIFGAPALEWTLEDVKAVRPLLTGCAKAARKAKRPQAQRAFNSARTFFSGNLRNYVRQRARAEAKLGNSLDTLLALPDSPRLLQTLALLRGLEAGDKEALGKSQKEVFRLGGPEAKAARGIVSLAFRQSPQDYASDTLPRIEERYQPMRAAYLEQAERQLAEHPDGPPGLAAVDAALAQTREEYGGGLTPADYEHLEQAAEAERMALRAELLDDARMRIDSLAVDAASLEQVRTIVADTVPSLDVESEQALRAHAGERRRAIAGEVLRNAEVALAAFPDTLQGIAELNRRVEGTTSSVRSLVDPARLEDFERSAAERRSDMAGRALAEFGEHLAGLANDKTGLEALDGEIARIESWQGLAPDVRRAYVDAVDGRRSAMRNAIAEEAREREMARQARVVAATKARIDAMTPRFRSLDAIGIEVREARGKQLDAAAMSEIEAHAAARRQSLADEILALAELKLGEAPATLDGLTELATMIETVIDTMKTVASASALADFERAASDESTALGERLFDEFERELAALTVDRTGLASAKRSTAWAERWRHVDADLRERFASAARARRDDIASELAAADAKRREEVIAAGGDPEIVGYKFTDKKGHSMLEFVDTTRVIFAVLGMRFGGKYEIVKDDVFVEGPNGTIVFARDGDTLTGMGLTLQRVEE